MQYTLMNARHEVLSFELDDKKSIIHNVRPLDGFKEGIAATLHGCDEATNEYIKLLQMAFEYQLNYVNKAAGIK